MSGGPSASVRALPYDDYGDGRGNRDVDGCGSRDVGGRKEGGKEWRWQLRCFLHRRCLLSLLKWAVGQRMKHWAYGLRCIGLMESRPLVIFYKIILGL